MRKLLSLVLLLTIAGCKSGEPADTAAIPPPPKNAGDIKSVVENAPMSDEQKQQDMQGMQNGNAEQAAMKAAASHGGGG